MKIAELTGEKASKTIGKVDTVIIPVGTLEKHGPHCSVMSDVLIPEKMADEVDRLLNNEVLVGPTIPYGHTWHLREHAGSHDVPGRVLSDYVFHVLKGFGEWGIKYAVLLNGHGGNIEALHDAAERASDLGIKTVVLSWWTGGFLDVLKEIVEDAEGHGGEAETSLLWNAGEKYVDKEAIPNVEHDYRFKTAATFMDIYDPDLNLKAFPEAYSGKPSSASAQKGRELIERLARAVVDVIRAMKQGTLITTQPKHS
jgi:creatinine amidohydrolase